MNIMIIGASGKAGKAILNESINRDLDVTAVVRDKGKLHNEKGLFKVLQKDIFELSYDDFKNIDVIVNAFGVWDPSQLDLHEKVARHLTSLLVGKPQTLIIVGGAGSLFIDKEKNTLRSSKEFPTDYLPVATAMANALAVYRATTEVNWVYLSPAAEFIADGERTGKYSLEGEYFTTNNDGESKISYSDYAIAMIDVVLSDKYSKERISVRW